MRHLHALALLAAIVPAASAAPADDVSRDADLLLAQAAQLPYVNKAPELPRQLSDLESALGALAQADPSLADAADAVKTRAAQASADAARCRDSRCFRAVAGDIQLLSADAHALSARSPSATLSRRASAVTAAPDAQVRADASAELGQRDAAARVAALADGAATLDGAAVVPTVAGPAAVVPETPTLTAQARPKYDSRVAALQTAIDAVRVSQNQKTIKTDGRFGGDTKNAVTDFQSRSGLPPTGDIDPQTQAALLKAYQGLEHLAPSGALDPKTLASLSADPASKSGSAAGKYFAGRDSDFEPGQAQQTIPDVLATVYYPYVAKSARSKKMEGSSKDRFGQTVCTVERFVAGSCPYVSVAIDSRLKVPNGTPLLIPGIDAIAGMTVRFRITDTGSKRYFKGTGHIDIATDSSERSGFGSQISGRKFTLVLPQGLHPTQL
jgi:peptidoglycan hydrolase-like protein with peptidoglycan-binding domain